LGALGAKHRLDTRRIVGGGGVWTIAPDATTTQRATLSRSCRAACFKVL